MKKKSSKTRRRISNRKMMNRKFTRKTRKRTRTRKKRVRTKRVRTQRGGEPLTNLKEGDKVMYTERGRLLVDAQVATITGRESRVGSYGYPNWYQITIDEDGDSDRIHLITHPYTELTRHPDWTYEPEPEPEPVKWPTGAELDAMPDPEVDEF